MDRPLTQHLQPGKALGLAEYEAVGGYQAIRRTLRDLSPEDVLNVVKDAGLRGRGGAGFPTALKWSFVPRGEKAVHPTYLIANADEMEPGTFKDRWLLEGNPHQIIEGLILAAYAIGADIGYLFLRAEYVEAANRMKRALAEAYAARYLGRGIAGAGLDFELHLHTSAGRYICGEETALINSLQGRRANPRAKPPFPQISGLFGKPTIVQNVETLANLPPILRHGAEWYRSLSRSKDGGTKIYGVSGAVKRPGLWELPLGTPIRAILEEHAGGMRDGRTLRGFLPGGASTDFLTPAHLDAPMDFDAIQAAGSRMGTGTVVVFDDRSCPVGMVHNLIRFFAQESCGWCTPCREGLPYLEQILRAIEDGRGEPGDLDVLERHTRLLGPGMTFCALAPGAVEPLQSALKYFRDDFERHIRDRRCPWRS
jgi:NADH-quinone oxidoreductase subunit F